MNRSHRQPFFTDRRRGLVTGTTVVNGTIGVILEVAGGCGILWDQHRRGCGVARARAVLSEVDVREDGGNTE